jgi:serine/threonine protein phosphatase PrpC
MSRPAAAKSPSRAIASGARLAICGATDIGAARSSNQDTFIVADLHSGELRNPGNRTDVSLSAQGTLLLVCDGMGGAAAGDLASRIAAESIKQQLVRSAPAAQSRGW